MGPILRILFCASIPNDIKLSVMKTHHELSEALGPFGWESTIITPDEIGVSPDESVNGYSEALCEYLKKNAADYDVVEFDHPYLPFDRTDFPQETLIVARSLLLCHHFDRIQIPRYRGLRALAGLILKEPARKKKQALLIENATRSMSQADLSNVSNSRDREELIRRGIPESRILVLPYGLKQARLERLQTHSVDPPGEKRVVFIGTFDVRKGAREFPDLAEAILSKSKDYRLRLLGARYRSEGEVLKFFPKKIQAQIEVVSSYLPDELPEYLADCSVGVFPSYVEGFPIGVIEMLASAVPVISYDSPGFDESLAPRHRVPPGNWEEMAKKVLAILNDRERLMEERLWARSRSFEFTWAKIATKTDRAYRSKLAEIRGKSG